MNQERALKQHKKFPGFLIQGITTNQGKAGLACYFVILQQLITQQRLK